MTDRLTTNHRTDMRVHRKLTMYDKCRKFNSKHCRIVNERPIDAQKTIDDVSSSVSDSLCN